MKTLLRENAVRIKERRLTKRVEKAWRTCARNGLPSWVDMQKLDLGSDWDFCFAVDLRLSDGFPYFIYMGDGLCRFSNIYLSGRRRCEETLLDVATAKMSEAALSRQPVFYDSVMRLFNRRRMVFRSVLLPLSGDSVDVTHVFGAANGRGGLPDV